MAEIQAAAEQYAKEGFAVIPGFLSESQVEELKAAMNQLVDSIDPKCPVGGSYNPNNNSMAGKYYLDSLTKAGYFFEKDAINENGELVVPKERCLHSIGHGLHFESEAFKKVSFSEKTKAVLKAIGYKKPAIIQGMVNSKNPDGIGAAFVPHQDATYLYTTPDVKVVGMWIPLEDSTLENGCLWFIPGSQTYPLDTRYVRQGPEEYPKLGFTNERETYDESLFVPAPVKKGDCVLIHGLVVHKSERNMSSKPRPAYTMHFYDAAAVEWHKDNVFQIPGGFPVLYEEQVSA